DHVLPRGGYRDTELHELAVDQGEQRDDGVLTVLDRNPGDLLGLQGHITHDEPAQVGIGSGDGCGQEGLQLLLTQCLVLRAEVEVDPAEIRRVRLGQADRELARRRMSKCGPCWRGAVLIEDNGGHATERDDEQAPPEHGTQQPQEPAAARSAPGTAFRDALGRRISGQPLIRQQSRLRPQRHRPPRGRDTAGGVQIVNGRSRSITGMRPANHDTSARSRRRSYRRRLSLRAGLAIHDPACGTDRKSSTLRYEADTQRVQGLSGPMGVIGPQSGRSRPTGAPVYIAELVIPRSDPARLTSSYVARLLAACAWMSVAGAAGATARWNRADRIRIPHSTLTSPSCARPRPGRVRLYGVPDGTMVVPVMSLTPCK